MRLNRPYGRVGLAMLGLDVHTKGIRSLSHRLAENGCDVSFFGDHLTPAAVAEMAQKNDVDVIGISFSSGAYVEHCRDLLAEMRKIGLNDVPLMIGGLIHKDDEPELKAMGVDAIFGPGSVLADILAYIESVSNRRIRTDTQNRNR